MEEKNCEILFEYLRDIIYDSENAKLDLEQLDEPFWKLGKGLQYLDKAGMLNRGSVAYMSSK